MVRWQWLMSWQPWLWQLLETVARNALARVIGKPMVDAAVKLTNSARCKEMARLLAQQQAKIDGLETQVRELTALITEQAQALNGLDQFTRRNSVIVYGLPEQANESVVDRIVELGRAVGVDVTGQIGVAHRIGFLSAGRTRPVIVRFKTFSARQELYAARRKLRAPGFVAGPHITAAVAEKIYLSDSLTKKGRQMRKNGRLWAVWSDAGKLKAKASEDDETKIIRSMDDLHRLVGSTPLRRLTRGADAAAVGGEDDEGDDSFIAVSAGTRRDRASEPSLRARSLRR